MGTVLAESGNDDYRWIRRLLGYGLGAATSYERLKHNAHWLSDTVAGAALGIATARFSMDRREGREAATSGLTRRAGSRRRDPRLPPDAALSAAPPPHIARSSSRCGAGATAAVSSRTAAVPAARSAACGRNRSHASRA